MRSTAEALNLIPLPETQSSHLSIVPSVIDAPESLSGHGGNRIRSGLRDFPRIVEHFGKPLSHYSDTELRAAIKLAQRNFQKT